MSDTSPRRPKWVTLLLVILPAWLIASGVAAIWFALHRENQQAEEEQQRFVKDLSVPMIADDLKKFVTLIGERNGSSEQAAKNLTRTASMIEGLLGPGNTGYAIKREKGPADWPIIHVTLRGRNPDLPALWVISSYDSRPGSPGAEANATGLAATLAAAQAVAGDTPESSIHFAFLPHANDPDSPILETISALRKIATFPKSILCVESMGADDLLWLSSRDTSAPPLALVQGLGSVRGAEVICLGEDTDLASILFDSGLPAVRVATRPLVTPDEPDDQLPSASTVAASAGRLVELIRRCSSTR